MMCVANFGMSTRATTKAVNSVKICSTSFREKMKSGLCTPTTHPNLAQRHLKGVREYVDKSEAVMEREIRTILESTRSNLEQSGFPERCWPLAAPHHAIAPNLTKHFDTGMVPWEARCGEPCRPFRDPGCVLVQSEAELVAPFGAKVVYLHNPKQNVPETSKFSSLPYWTIRTSAVQGRMPQKKKGEQDVLDLWDEHFGPGGTDDEGKTNARRNARPRNRLNRWSPSSLLLDPQICLTPQRILTVYLCPLVTIRMESGL